MKGLPILFCCFFCIAAATPVFGQSCANGRCTATSYTVVRERTVVRETYHSSNDGVRQVRVFNGRVRGFVDRLFCR